MRHWPCRKRLAAAALFVLALLQVAHAAPVTPKRVLLVLPADGYSPPSLALQQSILTHLRTGLGSNLQFFCEQLDATRLPESQEQALSWIRTRYATQGINVVILVGSVTPDILPGVPTIYAGYTSFPSPKTLSPEGNKITVWFKADMEKTISAARRLQPKANKVMVIAGSAYEDHILLEETRAQLRKSDLPVEYLTDASVEQLQSRVAQLSRDTILLPISYTFDKNSHSYYDTRDVVGLLSLVSTAPIYAAAETTIGSGAVGGYVVDFDRTGSLISEIVLETLAGKPAAQVSVPSESTASYIFDWRQLKRWGFSEKDLPAGSIVRFRSVTVWEQYRWRIIATIALVIAQFFLILRLLVIQRKRALAEASLRDMTGQLLASQDEERRRFARDLHDGTGQHLSAVALAIGQVLAKFPSGHPALLKLLQDSHAASRQALDEVRTVSFALHPPLLDNLGLVAAVRWYLDGLQKRSDLRINIEAPDQISHLEPEAERALFRILQESMSNILRHSTGKRIHVTLLQSENAVTLQILDDGDGMSAEQLAQVEGAAAIGVGIAGMRERLRQLDGKLAIHSSLSGTKVSATVPVSEERYAAAHSLSR
jgi:signal transduction histidine kinase